MGEQQHPEHPHGTPPGQDPDFVPPGHGGTPPGQEDKPDAEEPHPEHPIVVPDEDEEEEGA
jgi:hypothetical protein